MKRESALALIGMLAFTESAKPRDRYFPPEKPISKCLVCGASHKHNNSFCSVECCNDYKMKNKKAHIN